MKRQKMLEERQHTSYISAQSQTNTHCWYYTRPQDKTRDNVVLMSFWEVKNEFNFSFSSYLSFLWPPSWWSSTSAWRQQPARTTASSAEEKIKEFSTGSCLSLNHMSLKQYCMRTIELLNWKLNEHLISYAREIEVFFMLRPTLLLCFFLEIRLLVGVFFFLFFLVSSLCACVSELIWLTCGFQTQNPFELCSCDGFIKLED